MKNINYQSDFKLIETAERTDLTVPFIFSYFVHPNRKYVASFNGTEYKNCIRAEDGSLAVIFDKHGLGPGRLKVERQYWVGDAVFPDGKWNIVSVDDTGINLTTGKTDDVDVDLEVVLPYLKGDKGDSLTWSTMTESEKSEMIKELGEEIDNNLVVFQDIDDTTDYKDVF